LNQWVKKILDIGLPGLSSQGGLWKSTVNGKLFLIWFNNVPIRIEGEPNDWRVPGPLQWATEDEFDQEEDS
jgi:hypothetical protein